MRAHRAHRRRAAAACAACARACRPSRASRESSTASEVLLWPPEARKSAGLVALGEFRGALVAAAAADPAALAAFGIEHGFALSNLPTFAELLAAIEATGAREVALVRGPAEAVATALRERGVDAYPLGPPRQMTLPARV